MKLNKLYEKISGLIALELYDSKTSKEAVEQEFSKEFLFLNNMNKDLFKDLSDDEQFQVLRIYDVHFRIGAPMITDAEYDLYDSIYKQETNDTTPIMFEPSVQAWEKEKHTIVMGSLSKCNTLEEVEKWNNKPNIIASHKVISEKLDGISLELIYEKGVFKKAITRGDGKVGENITENAIYFDGVVKELGEKLDCAVRGEVMILKDNLNSINTILLREGKDALKNTRNGVAGQATKFKDRNEEILSLITFIAYEIQIFNISHTGENVL